MEDIKEKTADEMFSELGYKKSVYKYDGIIFGTFGSNTNKFIGFNIQNHSIDTLCESLTMQELQAINKKCKELKWI